MKTIGRNPIIFGAIFLILAISTRNVGSALFVLVVGGLLIRYGIKSLSKPEKEPSAKLEEEAPARPIAQMVGHTKHPEGWTGYIRVQFRDTLDRRPITSGATTYTYAWPHLWKPTPGTWVELPSEYGSSTGVIVENGYKSDYDGHIKPIVRVLEDMPPVHTEKECHCPPSILHPKLVESWGECLRRCEIEFEYLHRSDIASALRDLGEPVGGEIKTTAVLVQSTGRFPAVMIRGHWVGTLIEDASCAFRESLRKLAEQGKGLAVPARVWTLQDGSVLRSRVTVRLPEDSLIDPPGPFPAGAYLVLPAGSKVQVTGEEAYLNELASILDGEQEVGVVAELYRFEKASARSTKMVVGVKIYGDVVGVLTPASGSHFLPIVEACDEEGVAVCCRAVVKGNQLKADVVLNAAKVGDLSDEWIHEHLYKSLSGNLKSVPAPRFASDDDFEDWPE